MNDYNYNYDYYYTTSSTTVSPVVSLIPLAITVLSIVAMWKLFKKAGYQGWESIIPIYNLVILFKIAGLAAWYILLMLIPFVNIYVIFKLYIELAHKFGKSTGFGVATVFFSIICLPIMAFDSNCTYQGGNSTNESKPNVNNTNESTTQTQAMNNQMPSQENNGQNYFCSNCGTKLDNNTQFCPNCGQQRQ